MKLARKRVNTNSQKSKVLSSKSNDFQSIDHQRDFINDLANKFQISPVDDWQNITPTQIIKNGGKKLLQLYDNNLISMFSTLYPQFQFDFNLIKRTTKHYFKSIENQRHFMDKLYYKFHFTSFNDWSKISIKKINENGGKELLKLYSNDMQRLFYSIYPNYPFSLEEIVKTNANNYFQSIENQKQFMDYLKNKFQLNSLDDWYQITRKQLKENGGKSLISYYYSNDMKLLLSTIYPHHNWNFNILIKLNSIGYFKSIENQQKFMDDLFKKLELKSIEDWNKVSMSSIINNGGKNLLYHYENDFNRCIRSIYSDIDWDSVEKPRKTESIKYFELIENQRLFMNYLYEKFKLNSLDDWITISKEKIIENGGKNLFFYHQNIQSLLKEIFPFHQWNFGSIFAKKNYFHSILNQRLFFDNLFIKLKFKSLEDWKKITKNKLTKWKAKNILKYYSNNLKELFTSIYPNYPWKFENEFNPHLNLYYKSIDNQLEFIEKLYKELNFNSLDDWLKVSRNKLFSCGGKYILSNYSHSLKNMLTSLYPFYSWDFEDSKFNSKFEYFKSIENQRQFMNKLYRKFGLKSLDDWVDITRKQITVNGGQSLIVNYYENDMRKLLKTIYPDHHWIFSLDDFKYRQSPKILRSFNYNREKLLKIIQNYAIKEKKDWYRLPIRFEEINILFALRLVYSEEKWRKFEFLSTTKTTIQRLLFGLAQQIFHSFLLYENYRHPHTSGLSENLMEFDIFIPSLNLGIEYQGEHHYQDIPYFNNFELYQTRDKIKENFCLENSISLVPIPFWWDKSLPSLVATLSNSIYWK